MTFKTIKHIFLGLGLLISCNALYGAADGPNDAHIPWEEIPDGLNYNIYNRLINGETAAEINAYIAIHYELVAPIAPERIEQLQNTKLLRYLALAAGLTTQKLLQQVVNFPKTTAALSMGVFDYYYARHGTPAPRFWAPEEQWQEDLNRYRIYETSCGLAGGSLISLLASGAYSLLFEQFSNN